MTNLVDAMHVDGETEMVRMRMADRLTQAAVNAIGEAIIPGMRAGEALEQSAQVLRKFGASELWHSTMIRFGADTVKTFREPWDAEAVLGETDIFFVDIGPVWDGYEGDGAATFVVGQEQQMTACANAARMIFLSIRDLWLDQQLSGQELYRYARHLAEQAGWQLNMQVGGHRAGAYPNQSRKAGPLAVYSQCPAVGQWILEVQIRHPSRTFGAFYEGLLI